MVIFSPNWSQSLWVCNWTCKLPPHFESSQMGKVLDFRLYQCIQGPIKCSLNELEWWICSKGKFIQSLSTFRNSTERICPVNSFVIVTWTNIIITQNQNQKESYRLLLSISVSTNLITFMRLAFVFDTSRCLKNFWKKIKNSRI